MRRREEAEKEGNQEKGSWSRWTKGLVSSWGELLRSAYVLGKSRLGIMYKVVLGNGILVQSGGSGKAGSRGTRSSGGG
ncbi:unnamed protein product [Linum trigynum]|uniref:Uncharacterized protein n=1 Tax=Linum trigynum TaxID=586398 RepID=A0AAV2FA68_9ROSI